jgi:hypothetical protein
LPKRKICAALSDTKRLEEVVQAYRLDLEENTCERSPLQGASIIGNQEIALTLIAERRSDLPTSEHALSAQ